MKELRSANAKIEYTLRKSARARRIRITISRDAGCVVTVPRFASQQIADRLKVDEKTIDRSRKKIRKNRGFIEKIIWD